MTNPRGGIAFDYGMLGCLLVLFGGAYTDGWAHNNLKGLDTFFTPWHGILYGGFSLCAAYLAVAAIRGRMAGYAWLQSMPRGYELSLAGVAIFGVGGVLDMLWHRAFGIEADVGATVSPTHLLLFLGVALMYVGPLRAVLARGDVSAAARYAGVISLALLWSACTFFTQYALPFGETFSAASARGVTALDAYRAQALGISAVLLQTAFFIGIVLFAASRMRLPAGAIALASLVNATATAIMRQHDFATGPLAIVVAAVVAGALCDALYARLRPAPDRKRAWLGFAAGVPAIVYGVYFATVTVLAGTWWSPHMLFGAPVEAAGIGYLAGWLSLRE